MADCVVPGAALAVLLACPPVPNYEADDLVPPGTLAMEMTIGDHAVIDCRFAEEPNGHLNQWTAAHDRRPWDTQRYDPINPDLYPYPGREADISPPAFCVIRRISETSWDVVGGGPGLKDRVRLFIQEH